MFVRGIANITNNGTITIYTESQLDQHSISAAVWNALNTDYITPGTMGYSQSQVSGLSQNQTTMLMELYQLMGLDPTKPLVVTDTARTAGVGLQQIINTTQTQTTVTRV